MLKPAIARVILPLLLLSASALACSAAPDEASRESTSAVSGALLITGRWELATIKSYYYSGYAGSSVQDKHHIETTTRVGQGSVTELDLDGSGNGTIKAVESCKLSVPQKKDDGELGEIKGSPVALGVVGVLLLAEDIAQIAESVKCASGKRETGTQFAFPAGDSFWANVGVDGENKNSHAADAECHALRGHRYANVNGAVACFGFRDAAANDLEMLVQTPGEIYISRMTLRRTSRGVESEPAGQVGGTDMQCNIGAINANASALKACFDQGGGAPCLTDDSGRYRDAGHNAIQLCGLSSGGGYACSVEDLVACLKGGAGTACFAPQHGHCNKI